MIKKTSAALLFVSGVLVAATAQAGAAPAEARSDGAELLYRAPAPGSAQNAAFSPDGSQVLFTNFFGGYNKGGASLNRMPVGGGTPQELVREGDQAAVNLPGSAWNGRTGLITFSYDITDRDEIWTLAPGSEPRQVTSHTGTRGYTEPSFSPNGDWIVFQENDSQTEANAQGSIWKVRTDGTELTKLVDGPGTNTDNRQPNWSPSGDRIVFQSRSGTSTDWDLITIAPDATARKSLTTGPDEDTDPSFSPDGKWVVYSSDHAHTAHAQVFATRSDGTGQPLRVTTSTQYDGAPSWSPDGKWIAFESSADGRASTALWRIPIQVP